MINAKIILSFLVLICSMSSGLGQKKSSLYSTIFEKEGNTEVVIKTNLKKLIRKSIKEEYQEAEITIIGADSVQIIALPCRLRARGNMRKRQCLYPPIKVDFKKNDLDSLGFKRKTDRLKLVFPCRGSKDCQTKLYKEYLLYQIYKIIDHQSLSVKLANVKFIEENGKSTYFTGMFVEDEKAYAKRTDSKVIEAGKIRVPSLDRELFLKMSFFQYMIANTDYSIQTLHNLEMVKRPDKAKLIPVPYDFDYSGFVGHSYAVPYDKLPIKTVDERYFFQYKVTSLEFDQMVTYFLSIEDEINQTIMDADYLSEKHQNRSIDYLESFFDMLRKPKRLKREIVWE